jgi:hypothetical protein
LCKIDVVFNNEPITSTFLQCCGVNVLFHVHYLLISYYFALRNIDYLNTVFRIPDVLIRIRIRIRIRTQILLVSYHADTAQIGTFCLRKISFFLIAALWEYSEASSGSPVSFRHHLEPLIFTPSGNVDFLCCWDNLHMINFYFYGLVNPRKL